MYIHIYIRILIFSYFQKIFSRLIAKLFSSFTKVWAEKNGVGTFALVKVFNCIFRSTDVAIPQVFHSIVPMTNVARAQRVGAGNIAMAESALSYLIPASLENVHARLL